MDDDDDKLICDSWDATGLACRVKVLKELNLVGGPHLKCKLFLSARNKKT